MPSFEDNYIDFCCVHVIPYTVTFLSFGIFFPWFRAQILESDCLGSYPAATSYELPASVSPRVNGDNYDFYSTEVLGGFGESVTKYLQQGEQGAFNKCWLLVSTSCRPPYLRLFELECRISTISPKETFGIYQAVQTFLEGQWKYNTQFSVAPPSGTCSLLRKRDRIYTFTLTNIAVCTALTASQRVPGRAPPAG